MRRSFLGLVSITLLLALVFWMVRPILFKASASAQAQYISLDRYKTVEGLPDINAIFTLINNERLVRGLTPVVADAQLTRIAQERAEDMAAQQYYAHKSPQGKYFYDLMRDNEYYVEYGCENLDLAFTVIPDVYVRDWMNSKRGHRECILKENVTQAGYAVTEFKTNDERANSQKMYIVVTLYAELPAIAQ